MDQSCLFRENDRMTTGEPSLEEQLSEPIIRLLMASDGVAPDDLRRLCIAVRALRGNRPLTVRLICLERAPLRWPSGRFAVVRGVDQADMRKRLWKIPST